MADQEFMRCQSGHCMYFRKIENGNYLILILYVDDLLVASSNMLDINELKRKLANSFAMKDLGTAKQILGMRINRDKKKHMLKLSQEKYIEKVLKRFNMGDAKPVTTPLYPKIYIPEH